METTTAACRLNSLEPQKVCGKSDKLSQFLDRCRKFAKKETAQIWLIFGRNGLGRNREQPSRSNRSDLGVDYGLTNRFFLGSAAGENHFDRKFSRGSDVGN